MWPIRQICNNRTWMERELQHQLGGRITAEWVKFVYICMYLVQINVCMGKHISTLWRKKAPVNAECRRKFTQCRVSCVGQNIFENLFSLRWTCLVLVHLRGKLPRIYKLDGTTSNALKWNIVWALSLVPQTIPWTTHSEWCVRKMSYRRLHAWIIIWQWMWPIIINVLINLCIRCVSLADEWNDAFCHKIHCDIYCCSDCVCRLLRCNILARTHLVHLKMKYKFNDLMIWRAFHSYWIRIRFSLTLLNIILA